MVIVISNIMITQKEAVEEVIEMWKWGEKDLARFLVKKYQHILSPNIYRYLYEKTGIVDPEEISGAIIQAQNMMGGKIFNQYGVEINAQDEKLIPIFKK